MVFPEALDLVKAKLGITTNIRDAYIHAIINGVEGELQLVQGLVLESTNPHQLMFVVDLSSWRYANKDSEKGLPRHLQYRLHNLIIKNATSGEES